MATETLKRGYRADVEPILAEARRRAGGAIDPVAAYRASGYRKKVAGERPAVGGAAAAAASSEFISYCLASRHRERMARAWL
jgi:L-rhamnose isomerase